ncbi:MAG: TonB-dependent receptor domain-containing protein [Gammaproteobacteria bacterium]
MNKLIKFFIAGSLALGFNVPVFAQASLEEVIVTAQRTEQSLQDVPIAVTALSGDDLVEKQVITFSDLQINVPSLQFGQGQYADSSISLRGIGALAVGLSYDGSVGYHINQVPIPTSAIGDENFDTSRIEVLRGPQGTLFGRGSTGGAVNIVTSMPDFDEQYGSAKITAGNYNTQKFEGMFNMPINENLAVRFAGYGLKRDGYIDNLYMPDTHYDNRDQGAGRMTIAWQDGDTSASLMFQQYNENSHRSRKGDYICTTSPTPDRGCILGGTGKDMPNPAGTYDGMIGAYLLNIAPRGGNYQKYIDLGLLSGNAIRPTGMNRQQTHSDFEPTWENDNETVIFEIAHQLDAGELSLSYSTYDAKYKSRADTDMTVGPRIGCVGDANGTIIVNDGTSCLSPAQNATAGQVIMYDLVTGGDRGVGGPTIAEENFGGSPTAKTGIYQDNYILQSGNRTTFINGNVGENQTRYTEAKFVSDFAGPHNFLLGVNYMELEAIDRFLTASSPLTMLAGAAAYYLPTFGPHEAFSMQALGVFGEYYYQINDDMKLTIGARWADETKDRDTIDASYYTAVDYAAPAYSSAAFNVGGALRTAGTVVAGQAFPVDAAVHTSVLNFALLESTTDAVKTALSSGAANGSAFSASGAEAIAREEARTGVNYTTAINAATKNYVVGFNAIVDALAGNDVARQATTGYIASLATANLTGAQVFAGMTEAQKVAVDRGIAKVGNLANYVTLVQAAGAVPSMQTVDSGYLNPTWPSYLQDKFDYETVAGRVVFDWQYNDNSMFYASYARGVKPGGVNASVNPRTFKPCSAGVWGAAGPAATCVDVPPQTEEEVADTFEVGVKTDLMDGQLRLNATAFFTDYTDLQIASTINASEFNFNSDAEITGAEIELTYLPEAFPNLRVDFMANFLDTEIISADNKLNPFNKLAIGMPEDISATHAMLSCTVILFDSTDACIGTRFIVEKSELARELAAGTYTNGNHNTLTAAEMWVMDLGTLDGSGNILTYPTYGDRNYYDAPSFANISGFMNVETSGGATVSIKGNSLPQAPEESFNLAFSYNYAMGNGMTLIPTASFYYQSEMFNSEFNSTLSDQIDSWEEVNLGLTVIPAQGDWVARLYVRNATDEDNVTTKFNSTDITGNYQTWQYRDPRTVGLELTMDF